MQIILKNPHKANNCFITKSYQVMFRRHGVHYVGEMLNYLLISVAVVI